MVVFFLLSNSSANKGAEKVSMWEHYHETGKPLPTISSSSTSAGASIIRMEPYGNLQLHPNYGAACQVSDDRVSDDECVRRPTSFRFDCLACVFGHLLHVTGQRSSYPSELSRPIAPSIRPMPAAALFIGYFFQTDHIFYTIESFVGPAVIFDEIHIGKDVKKGR